MGRFVFQRDRTPHLAIAEAAGSPSLVLSRNIAHSDEQHEAIVVAILTADADGAAAAMRAHVAGSAALPDGFLD